MGMVFINIYILVIKEVNIYGNVRRVVDGLFYCNLKICVVDVRDGLSNMIFLGEYFFVLSDKIWVGVVFGVIVYF